jgi:hypothetical protein
MKLADNRSSLYSLSKRKFGFHINDDALLLDKFINDLYFLKILSLFIIEIKNLSRKYVKILCTLKIPEINRGKIV